MSIYEQSIGSLARDIPGATRVFRHYELDFCCGGQHTLLQAAKDRGLDAKVIADALEALRDRPRGEYDWTQASASELIDHIVTRYHARHREQLPELIRLAHRVEEVHGDRPDCPAGLADHLRDMLTELESHMSKEEQILFPLLARGHSAMVRTPIAVMRLEHEQHGDALDLALRLTNNITLPEAACNTWRALYTALEQFRDDLIDHIHLENNILFATTDATEHSNV